MYTYCSNVNEVNQKITKISASKRKLEQNIKIKSPNTSNECHIPDLVQVNFTVI